MYPDQQENTYKDVAQYPDQQENTHKDVVMYPDQQENTHKDVVLYPDHVAAPQIGGRKGGHKQLFRLPVVRCTRSEKSHNKNK